MYPTEPIAMSIFHDHPFEYDGPALANLDKLDIEYVGGIIKLIKGTEYPPQVLNACDYLCDEWDYGLEWIDKPSKPKEP